MLDGRDCKDCIHFNVCSLKEKYKIFAQKIYDVEIAVNENKIYRLADCSDVDIILKCKHFREDQPLTKNCVVTKC